MLKLILTILFCLAHCPTAPIISPDNLPNKPEEPAQPAQDEGPYWGIGQLWNGISQWDTGYCPGYQMPEGNGPRPGLLMPVDGQIREDRPFTIKHTGLDIEAVVETEVRAALSGRVIWAGWSTWGFGNVVAIDFGGGWYAILAHLDSVRVKCGDWIYGNDVVGSVGKTGQATFYHVHIELRNGHFSYSPGL